MTHDTILLGDNLELMREMPSESVDLVATDPPFNTGKDWGEFDDRWEGGLKGYLKFMESRIIEIHRLLKPTGSFYLHCDPTASHYLKVLCDTIFGVKQFRNEIVWCFERAQHSRIGEMPNHHNTIFWYSIGKEWTFNLDDIRIPYSPETHKRCQNANNTDGWSFRDQTCHPKGKVPNDWIVDIPYMRFSSERLGYPTQKPLALYQRIIKASSNKGDLVLDPFCGSGTTLAAAKHLFRKYIGIDQNPKAVEIAERRLNPPQQDIPF